MYSWICSSAIAARPWRFAGVNPTQPSTISVEFLLSSSSFSEALLVVDEQRIRRVFPYNLLRIPLPYPATLVSTRRILSGRNLSFVSDSSPSCSPNILLSLTHSRHHSLLALSRLVSVALALAVSRSLLWSLSPSRTLGRLVYARLRPRTASAMYHHRPHIPTLRRLRRVPLMAA